MIHHLMEKSNIKQKQNECQEIEKKTFNANKLNNGKLKLEQTICKSSNCSSASLSHSLKIVCRKITYQVYVLIDKSD